MCCVHMLDLGAAEINHSQHFQCQEPPGRATWGKHKPGSPKRVKGALYSTVQMKLRLLTKDHPCQYKVGFLFFTIVWTRARGFQGSI